MQELARLLTLRTWGPKGRMCSNHIIGTITKIGRAGLLHSVASGTAFGSTRSNRVSSVKFLIIIFYGFTKQK